MTPWLHRGDSALPAAAGLWPDEGRRMTRRPGREPALLVLPSRRRPRLLVPSDVPAASCMLRRHSPGRAQRLGQELLAAGQRRRLLNWVPLSRLLTVDESGLGIETLVKDQLGASARVGVLLGPPRANAKPVLQVFDAQGSTIAFGKVGGNDTSRALVRAETKTLVALSRLGLQAVEIPAVLWNGNWRGLEVLLISPMSSSQERASSWDLPAEAMREVAETEGVQISALDASAYLAELVRRCELLFDPGTGARGALAELTGAFGSLELRFGRWHGDWAPWNMGIASHGVQVWDWERSCSPVPLGFDVAHFSLQREIRTRADAPIAARAVLRETRRTLSQWYPADDVIEQQAAATVMMYLVEIQCRYRADTAGMPGPALRSRLNVIEAMTSDIATQLRGSSRASA